MAEVDRRFMGVRFLVAAASLIVLVAGLRAAQSVLVPFVFAVFLALLGAAPLSWLRRRKVPSVLAVFLVVLIIAGLFILVAFLLGTSINEFSNALPRYHDRFRELQFTVNAYLDRYQIQLSTTNVLTAADPGSVMELFTRTLRGVGAALSATFLVIVFVLFMLLEAAEFKLKLQAAFGAGSPLGRFEQTVSEIQRYLAIKTVTSVTTGIMVGLLTYMAGLDFPVLWGMVAFLMNYIPVIGSILAAIPAILLALVQLEMANVIVITIGYLVINNLISNVIEPIFMGRGLGLSPLVILLSLAFWGWIWGPVGMLLSVPLTMVAKILLEHSKELRWLAILMGGRAQIKAQVANPR